jgi:hypothetical protein
MERQMYSDMVKVNLMSAPQSALCDEMCNYADGAIVSFCNKALQSGGIAD